MELSLTDRMASDEILVRWCQRGDKRAFDALVGKYWAAIYQVAYRMLMNESDAEDVTQEVFLRAYRSIRRCDPKKGFENWLYRIALNRCRTQRAASANERAVSAADLHALSAANRGEEIPDLAAKREARDGVRRALSVLPARQRAALVLFEMRGLRMPQIAEVMRCSLGSVKRHLHRARARLRRDLSEIAEEE